MASHQAPRTPRFLVAYPPWYARSAGILVLALIVLAAIIATRVRVPRRVTARFTLVPGPLEHALVAELWLPERAFLRVRPGMRARLAYDALASEGAPDHFATVLAVKSEVHDGWFVAHAALDDVRFATTHGERALVPGLAGTADLVTGKVRLVDLVDGPWRAAEEAP
jgi:hypothetical protein